MSNDDYKSNDSENGFQNEGIDRFVDDLVQGKLPSDRDLTSIERALVEISSFSSPDREFGGSSVVEQMSEQIAKVAEHPHLRDKRAIFTRVLGAKALLAATTAVALTGTAAAAASGSLPAPIQQVFASAASNLGVSLPSSPPTTEAPGSSSSQNQGGSAQTQQTTTTTVISSLALGPTTTVTAPNAITKTGTSNCVSGSAQIAYSPDIATSISTGNSNPTSTTSSSTTSSTSSTTTTEPASTTTTISNKCVTPATTTTTSSTTTTTSSTTTTTSSTTTTSPTTTTTAAPNSTTTTAVGVVSSSLAASVDPNG